LGANRHYKTPNVKLGAKYEEKNLAGLPSAFLISAIKS